MKKIFKYPIKITDSQSFPMPVGANILTVQVQNGIINQQTDRKASQT